MPCEVLAYLRFSIFFLQFRHLKHVAQKAWSPVRMARSSILLLQTLQLYVQLLQISDPSPRRRRFASESRMVPQVLQRKQSMCHRLPAGRVSVHRSRKVITVIVETYQVRRLFLPRVSKCRSQSLALRPSTRRGYAERQPGGVKHTSPHPLQGYAASSCSIGDSGKPEAESMIIRGTGLPEPSFALAMDSKRPGQRIDRAFDLPR